MKKFLLISIGGLFLLLFITVSVVFLNPETVLNPKVLGWALDKSKVFESWSWKSATINHERRSLFHRNLSGAFTEFCFHINKPAVEAKGCFEKISWDFDLIFSFKEGLDNKTLQPFFARSSNLEITPKDTPKEPSKEGPPDIQRYWNILWSDFVPDMDVGFNKIVIKKEKPLLFDLKLMKTAKNLEVTALDFTFSADPEKFTLTAPARYPFPKDLGTSRPLYFKNFILTGKMNDNGIPLELSGFLETVKINASSFIKLPLVGDLNSVEFKKQALASTKARIALTGLKESLRDYAPKPFNQLPAPFNIMDGDIILELWNKDLKGNFITSHGKLSVDLKSPEQVVSMVVDGAVPLNVKDFSRGTMELGIDFNELTVKLPRFSKKALPPQLKPDGRFKTHEQMFAPKKDKNPLNLNLQALNEKALHIKSNLLDEPIRLNFDLNIINGVVKEGFLTVLPLKTTVFKRPIRVQDMRVDFRAPLSPVIKATVLFPLPTYKVTMKVEGPMDKPRYAFSSEPPLPESDIYAVLLFGRPMNDLDSDNKTAASKTNQILSRGLALSTLYFLAGSPVEYVGYDPDSRNATAQFGLGEKSSLRVGGGREGVNSTAIRRSLGKGWYVDTSVQNTSTGVEAGKAKNYGVLLERIIAY